MADIVWCFCLKVRKWQVARVSVCDVRCVMCAALWLLLLILILIVPGRVRPGVRVARLTRGSVAVAVVGDWALCTCVWCMVIARARASSRHRRGGHGKR